VFLLDSNVFISAHRDYYPPDRVPEYWDWLVHQADAGAIKVPQPIWDEIKPHDEELKGWLQIHQNSFLLNPDESDVRVADVLAHYGENLTDDELEQIGADPFLIAAALHYEAVVVSKEGSKPSKERANRRVPDIRNAMGVLCITDHKLIVELDFRTNWKP
jgi:hypothetical protein